MVDSKRLDVVSLGGKEVRLMRVSLNLSDAEVKMLHRVAKQNIRTVALEATWAVLLHINASTYKESQAPEPTPDEPEADEHPF